MTTDTVRENATSTSEFAAPLPAGTYLVGDPCYSFTNDVAATGGRDYWDEWLAAAWKDVDANRVRILDAEVAGFRVAASGTAYGDGAYADQSDREYLVDAGLLGAVPFEAIAVLYPEYAGKTAEEVAELTSTHVEVFEQPFHVRYDDGFVMVGHVAINTGDDDEDDRDYCWSCGESDCEGECLESDDEGEED